MAGAIPFFSRELGLRLASALVLIPLAVLAVLAGDPWFPALLAATLTVAAHEWARMTGIAVLSNAHVALLAAPVAAVAGASAANEAVGLAAGLSLTLVAALLAGPRRRLWAALGGAYLCVPGVACLFLWRSVEDGSWLILWLFVAVWVTDSVAYVAGRLIGGPKLWPAVSPGKTWAGLIGGVGGSMLATYLFALYLSSVAPASLALLGAGLALVAQGGDLSKSAVKRRFGAKDFGRLIPGHGGVLDRIDGLLAAAVALALVVLLSGGEQGPPGWR